MEKDLIGIGIHGEEGTIVMMKEKDGVVYDRCFHCGKFFSPTIIDMELQLFCSDECEKADSEYWEKIIANDYDTNRRI